MANPSQNTYDRRDARDDAEQLKLLAEQRDLLKLIAGYTSKITSGTGASAARTPSYQNTVNKLLSMITKGALALVATLSTVTFGIKKFLDGILAVNVELGKFSPSQALNAALLDVTRYFANFRVGEGTAGTGGELTRAWGAMLEALVPVRIELINVANTIATEVVQAITKWVNSLTTEQIEAFLKYLLETAAALLRGFGNFLQSVGHIARTILEFAAALNAARIGFEVKQGIQSVASLVPIPGVSAVANVVGTVAGVGAGAAAYGVERQLLDSLPDIGKIGDKLEEGADKLASILEGVAHNVDKIANRGGGDPLASMGGFLNHVTDDWRVAHGMKRKFEFEPGAF